MVQSAQAVHSDVIDQIFQWASALGTCGFNSVKIAIWSQPALLILITGMFIGGMAGSTTGGVKINRVTWLCKSIIWRLRSIWIEDRHLQRYFYDGLEINDTVAMRRVGSAALLSILYLVAIISGTLGLLLILGHRYSLYEILFEVISALGGVGLSVGVTSTDLPHAAKTLLVVLMWMGRLEIVGVLVLITSPFIGMLKRR